MRGRTVTRAATKKPPDTKKRRARLVEIGSSLPEAEVVAVGAGQHLAFRVRKRTFAYSEPYRERRLGHPRT